uniref:Thioredoxin n=1 Tax=Favella ehrenbergii TaxID=182087 RepID=A0A7S3I681_9SPIT
MIKDQGDFDQTIAQNKLVVVDFTATWCGPCQRIAPFFTELATKNPDVEFVKVDVDECDEVAASCGVQSMPTFHFYKDGKMIHSFSGANSDVLASKVAELK